jgi:hypothetical protein
MNFFSPFHAPANTNGYFIAGYAIFFVIMSIYLASLFIRNHNLKQEYALLVELDRGEQHIP